YEYDALSQLITATGREHASAVGDAQRDQRDIPSNPLPHPNDPPAIRNYTELYQYDTLGNITSLQHIANNANWTRRYQYAYQVDPNDRTNRLVANSRPGDPSNVFSAAYTYDNRGNIASMPHL